MEFLKKLFRRKALVIVVSGEGPVVTIVGYLRADTLEEMDAEFRKRLRSKSRTPQDCTFYKVDDMRRFSGPRYSWEVIDKAGRCIGHFARCTTWEAVVDAYHLYGKRLGRLVRVV